MERAAAARQEEEAMPQLSVKDLLNYLDAIQRHYGGEILCWVVATTPAGKRLVAPLLEAGTEYGAAQHVSLLLCGPKHATGSGPVQALEPHPGTASGAEDR